MRECIKKIIICGILSCNINYVSGDVFELKQNAGISGEINITADNTTEFQRFINVNRESLPMKSIDPFVGEASNAIHMLGYAVFFPEGNYSSQKIYVAKKRTYIDEGTPITNYEKAKSIEDFQNSTNFDHTERQLIAKIISDYGINNKTEGCIYIYTEWAPCKNNNDDNANYPCIKYYESLAKYLPNIQLHICFQKFENISEASIDEAYCTDGSVICELMKLITSNKGQNATREINCDLIINCKGNPKINLVLDDGLKRHIESTLNETIYKNAHIERKYRRNIISKLNNILRANNILNGDEKTRIFNKLYNPSQKLDNLHYKCIRHPNR